MTKEGTIKKYYKKVLRITNEKILKTNIKNKMIENNIRASSLSKKSNINIVILILLLYFPFYKVKLSQSIRICKVLNLYLIDIIWHPIWHTSHETILYMLHYGNDIVKYQIWLICKYRQYNNYAKLMLPTWNGEGFDTPRLHHI